MRFKLIVGKYIKRRIDELGFTQKQISELCGVDQSNLARLVNGKYNCSLDVLERVCDSIGLCVAFVEPLSLEEQRVVIKNRIDYQRECRIGRACADIDSAYQIFVKNDISAS